jgi:cell division protein ZapA (FtsZ GTPase activity inhibitor)
MFHIVLGIICVLTLLLAVNVMAETAHLDDVIDGQAVEIHRLRQEIRRLESRGGEEESNGHSDE